MLLIMEDISFSYGKKQILRGVSLTLDAGECLVVAGENGSGKSTLLSLISGANRPQRGSMVLNGRVGTAPQGTALFEDMSVGYNLSFFAGFAGVRQPENLPLGVEKWRKTRVSKLSGGEKKRVSIACALTGEPDILLLDEPCAGLDAENRGQMAEIVLSMKKQGKGVIYVSHDPEEFESFYDRIVYLKDGKIYREEKKHERG